LKNEHDGRNKFLLKTLDQTKSEEHKHTSTEVLQKDAEEVQHDRLKANEHSHAYKQRREY